MWVVGGFGFDLVVLVSLEESEELVLFGLMISKVLSDDKKRALYDQYGEAGVKSTVGGPSSAYTTNPFDLFETFFGSSMSGFPGMDQTGFQDTSNYCY
ncbi:hypothetical protein OIU77_027857 [Salix suchowensis]|uniref:Uncharacterized protein n=1 Tax=Salix suchowensis TaxID=1278906 RepID=A0ABQ9BSS5_9ROSI|nr:hypothetical protein OIU77_027857 [Salix suchowensis]